MDFVTLFMLTATLSFILIALSLTLLARSFKSGRIRALASFKMPGALWRFKLDARSKGEPSSRESVPPGPPES